MLDQLVYHVLHGGSCHKLFCGIKALIDVDTLLFFMDKIKLYPNVMAKNFSQAKIGIIFGIAIPISIFLLAEPNAALVIIAIQGINHLVRTNNFNFIQ